MNEQATKRPTRLSRRVQAFRNVLEALASLPDRCNVSDVGAAIGWALDLTSAAAQSGRLWEGEIPSGFEVLAHEGNTAPKDGLYELELAITRREVAPFLPSMLGEIYGPDVAQEWESIDLEG